MFIILEGDFEIVKMNLDKVYFNSETAMLGIPEENTKAQLIRSNIIHNNFSSRDEMFSSSVTNSAKYIGSQLQHDA